MRLDRRTVHRGLGAYPVIGLEQARRRAAEYRAKAAAGIDPGVRADVPTVREATEQVIEARRPGWKDGGDTERRWRSAMQRHVYPAIGGVRVDEVTATDVRTIIALVAHGSPRQARQLRRRLQLVLAWCESREYVPRNVAGSDLDATIPSAPRKEHWRALPHQDVPALVDHLSASELDPVTIDCLLFLILTVARSGEARGARWTEIDWGQALWRVPVGRMKTATEHHQVLCGPALDVLGRARARSDGSEFVFPSPRRRGKPLGEATLWAALRRIGWLEHTTVHGIRSAFSDWAHERADAEYAVIELSLAHQVGSAIERAYARGELLEKRRRLMQAWGLLACGEGAGNRAGTVQTTA